MTIPLSDFTPFLPVLGWGFALGIVLFWLPKAWTLRLFESEGKPSIRLALAAIVVIFTLCMEAADRLPVAVIDANLFFAGALLGLGTAKVIGSRFASRPHAPRPPQKAPAGEIPFSAPAKSES